MLKLLILFLILASNLVFGQDTIWLNRRPQCILKSWYPEFKDFPKLKIGENKIIFTLIPDLNKTPISGNDINLIYDNKQLKIEETEKINQYILNLNSTDSNHVEFELWFDLGKYTILIMENNYWRNVKEIYPVNGNRILIDRIRLKIEK